MDNLTDAQVAWVVDDKPKVKKKNVVTEVTKDSVQLPELTLISNLTVLEEYYKQVPDKYIGDAILYLGQTVKSIELSNLSNNN
jgi:hypothetical protein